jgi:asparagine synthase (glutamine-hydrolysing)
LKPVAASAVFAVSSLAGREVDTEALAPLLQRFRRGDFFAERRALQGGTYVVGGLTSGPRGGLLLHGSCGSDLRASNLQEALIGEVSGEFALVGFQPGCVAAARDPLGAKPLYQGAAQGLAVVSTEPSVIAAFAIQPVPASPGHIVILKDGQLTSTKYCGDLTGKPFPGDVDQAADRLGQLLRSAIKARLGKGGAVGVAFSGGLDSSLLALLCSKECHVVLISVFAAGSRDASRVSSAADELGLELLKVRVGQPEVEGAIQAASLPAETRPMDRALSAGFIIASKVARDQGLERLAAGQGADEIFGGYNRHLELASSYPDGLNRRLIEELPLLEAGLRRDESAIVRGGCEASFPYADLPLARFALNLPQGYLISGGTRKVVLRRLAAKVGLPLSMASAEKKAFQYSSGIQSLL